MCILMRPLLSSRSSKKPRGAKIRACPHSDLGEFLFLFYSDDVIAFEVKKSKNPYQISRMSFFEIPSDLAEKLNLTCFPCFQFFRKICKTRYSLSQKTQKC